jgi:hypothetical protein
LTIAYRQLVKRLYEPGSLKEVSRIDDEIKRLQHLPQGWMLADYLLSSDNVNVRFVGALTFQIKLNAEGHTQGYVDFAS